MFIWWTLGAKPATENVIKIYYRFEIVLKKEQAATHLHVKNTEATIHHTSLLHLHIHIWIFRIEIRLDSCILCNAKIIQMTTDIYINPLSTTIDAMKKVIANYTLQNGAL